MRIAAKLGLLASVLALSGCSVHPIPDDVSPVPTQGIVKSVRCETKFAVRNIIDAALKQRGIRGIKPDEVMMAQNLAAVRAVDPILATKFELYGASAISYDFTFDITEHNNLDANAGFTLPFSNGAFDLTLGQAFVHKQREAKRQFNTTENFAALANLDCSGFEIRDGDLLYPVNGSIGMKKTVETFIGISEMGGLHKNSTAQSNFQDTLQFTTEVEATLKPQVTVTDVVPNQFRLKSGWVQDDNYRKDFDTVIVALAFPDLTALPIRKDTFGNAAANTGTAVALTAAGLKTLAAESVTRAQENLCIARAINREDTFGTLRLQAPEQYCKSTPGTF